MEVIGLIDNIKADKKAAKRAFNKTLKWYQSQVTKEATTNLGIKRSALKGRWFIDNARQKLWLGLNDLPAHRIGKPRQNKKGVRVGKSQFDGAFIMNGKLVMIREGKDRLPITMITKEVSDELTLVFNRYRGLALKRFEKLFEQERNFARNHEKR